MPVIRKEFSLKTRATATALAIFLTGIGLHSWYATSVLQGDMERLLGQQQYSTASYMAADIQERVLQIYEACNFQDLTGQRITKVVNVLRFIEDRVNRMMEIWGGMEAFASIESDESLRRVGDAALLNGPALPNADQATQDDIDALFA